MYKLYFRFFIVALFSSFITEAQTSISGIILEKDTKEPISNVHIIYGNSAGTFSNLNGYFEFVLPEGTHDLSFQHLSFKTHIIKEISSVNNKAITLDIELQAKYDQLETVVLSAGKFEQRLEDISVSLDQIKWKFIENHGSLSPIPRF